MFFGTGDIDLSGYYFLDEESVCGDKKINSEPAKRKKLEKRKQKQQQNITKIQSGVQIEDIYPGLGSKAKPGDTVSVYYEARLKSNNKLVWRTCENGYTFTIDNENVIKDLNSSALGMQIKGKRRISFPLNADHSSALLITSNSTESNIFFYIELKEIH